MCPNCHNLETERHVLNNCPTAATLGRYTWRHDAVLRHLATIIEVKLSSGSILYVDLPGYSSPDDIFINMRPDLVITNGSAISVLELTCCYEQNLDKFRMYKTNKYSNLKTKCSLNLPVKCFYT